MCFVFVLHECDINNKQKLMGVQQEVSALLIQAERRLFHAESNSLISQNKPDAASGEVWLTD